MTSSDLAAVKQRQQSAWSSGNYANLGSRTQLASELLCEAADVRAGERVLDVATGSGNTALAAARRFCEVVGVDYVPELLAQGRRRAEAEGLEVSFQQGDAEALPAPDGSFDVVVSTFGVMFAPDQHKAAAELLRVCRPGGRIALASWVPDGAGGAVFKAVAEHVPPPAGVSPATLWGVEDHVCELFGSAADVTALRRPLLLRYPSREFWVDYFAAHYGPILKAFETVGASGAPSLRADLIEALRTFDRSDDDTLVLQQDYLEVVAHKQ